MPLQKLDLKIDYPSHITQLSRYIADRSRDFTGREWVFKAINNWLADPNGSRYFLLIGEPGSGKTTIAGRLWQISRSEIAPPSSLNYFIPGYLNAVHFCSINRPTWIDPQDFPRFLALQLGQLPEYVQALTDIVQDGGQKLIDIHVSQNIHNAINAVAQGLVIQNLTIPKLMTAQESFNLLILKPLKKIYSQGYSQSITILVDGLDEALKHEGEFTIVDLISRVEDLPSQVRLLLTCRPGTLLYSLQLKAVKCHLTSSEGLQQSRKDINQYARLILQQHPDLIKKFSSNLSKNQFLTVIQDKSNGNFLYVICMVTMLQQESEITQEVLNDFPNGLNGIYLEFLDRLVGSNQKSKQKWRRKYRSVLGILAVAREPLSCNQLARFSKAKNQTTVIDTLEEIQQFLDFDESVPVSLRTYTIYHSSFSEFLLNQNLATNTYWCEEQEQHRYIVKAYSGKSEYWWQEVNDPYFWKYYVYHLFKAEYRSQLDVILLNINWLQAKLDATGSIRSLIHDYKYLLDNFEFCLIHDALCLSSPILQQDPTQLKCQLVGRLLVYKLLNQKKICKLLETAENFSNSKWLRPMTPALAKPGSYLKDILHIDADMVHAVAVTPDEKILISASEKRLSESLRENRLEVWSLVSGELLQSQEAHDERIMALAVSPDGSKVVSGSSDGSIKLWNLVKTKDNKIELRKNNRFQKKYEKSQRENNQDISSIVVTCDGMHFITGSFDGTIKKWNMENCEVHIFPEGHSHGVISLTVTQPQNHLISMGQDKTIKLWDLDKCELLRPPLEGHLDWVNSAQAILDDKRVICAFEDGSVEVWNLQTDPPKKVEEKLYGSPVHSIVAVGNGLLVSAFDNGLIEIWDVKADEAIPLKHHATLKYHYEAINMLLVTSRRKQLISASWDGSIAVWTLENDINLQVSELLKQFEGHNKSVKILFVVNEQFTVSASADHQLKIWNTQTGELIRRLEGHTREITAVVLSPNKKQVISGSKDGTINIWNLETGELVFTLKDEENSGGVIALAVAPSDWAKIVSLTENGILTVWQLLGGQLLWKANLGYRFHDVTSKFLDKPTVELDEVIKVVVTQDGCHALLGLRNYYCDHEEDNLAFVELKYPKKQWRQDLFLKHDDFIKAHDDFIKAVLITENEHRAISASCDGAVKIWDLTNLELLNTLEHGGAINSVALDEKSSRIVSASSNSTLKVWNLENGWEEFSLDDLHTDSINAVKITSNGKWLISVSDDKTLVVSDLDSRGKVTARFFADSPLLTCDVTSDDSTIVAGDKSGNLHFLRLEGKESVFQQG